MAFEWSPTDYISKKNFEELEQNIDTTYANLELSSPSYNHIPPKSGSSVNKETIEEGRDKIDYAEDMNYCRSHDSGHYTDDNDNHCVSHQDGHYTDNDHANNVTHHFNENTQHDSGDDSSYDGSHDGGYDSSYNSTHRGGDDTDEFVEG